MFPAIIPWRPSIVGLTMFLAVGMAQAQSWSVEDLPPDAVQRLGREMYEQDSYVALATDLLFEKAGGPDRLAQEGLRGAWVVGQAKDATIVRFLKEGKGDTVAGYDVVFADSRPGYVHKPADGRLSEADLAQARARRLAVDQVRERCSERYNTVVLRQTPGGDLLVYALAATADPRQMMVGGHYRVTVTPDGRKVVKVEKLFRGCVTLRTGDAAGAVPWVTHIVSARPLETHVYLSLLYRRPLYVGVDKAVWKIEAGRATLVDQGK
jgi:hypothetical protein